MTTSCSSARLLVLLIAPLFACATTYAGGPGTPPPAPAAKNPDSAASHYGQIPLSFEANHGQADKRVKFLSHGDGYSLFLTDQEAVLALDQTPRCPAPATPSTPRKSALNCETSRKDVLRMSLAGANTVRTAEPTGEDPLPGKVNYFLGNNPTKWHTGLPTYAHIKYTGVYDGIDLVYYGNQRQLEHDFVVHPGADPGRIALSFNLDNSSSANLHIDRQTGDLVLNSGASDLRLLRPVTYQEINGQRHPISSSYKLLAGNRVSFSIGSYDHTLPLTIDPVLVYSTYLGGSGTTLTGDRGNGIVVDAAGSAYVVGTTASIDFPVTAGAIQSKNLSSLAVQTATVFVSKFNAAGTALTFSTYLGGSAGDYGYGIALDAANNVYVTGATYSIDFPLTCGVFQTTKPNKIPGAPSAFVAKLSATGNTLSYSTFLGGTGQLSPINGDVAQAIAVDPSGNAYVTGYTYSSDFPVTSKAFQTSFAGSASSSNGFVSKLNPAGSSLAYSTYLGGSGFGANGDSSNAIALDGAGDAFVTGVTYSTNFPVTPGAFATTFQPSGMNDSQSFVTELNPAGTSEVFSTYLGGSDQDSAQAIAVDSKGFAYVAGNTSSIDFPVTSGALQSTSYGILPPVGFITKLNLTGTGLVYSTYLQGQQTFIMGLAVDASGTAYLAGNTSPLNAGKYGGFQSSTDSLFVPSGTTSAFLIKLDPTATQLNYATLLGGSGGDEATAIALDSAGNAYLAGFTSSGNFPHSAQAFQGANANAHGGTNAFVAKFALAGELNQTPYPPYSGQIPTIFTAMAYIQNVQCDGNGFGFTTYDACFSWSLTPTSPGPALQGEVSFDPYYPFGGGGPYPPYPSVSSNFFCLNNDLWYGGDPITATASGSYPGDANYQPSSASYTASFYSGCPASPAATGSLSKAAPRPRFRSILKLDPQQRNALFPTSTTRPRTDAKFTPPPLTEAQLRAIESEPQSQANGSCTNTLPTLTITMNSTWRTYGAANPTFLYTTHGLLNGDTVTVTPFTTATAASPVGSYPITASVSGPAAPNYLVVVVDGTLSVHQAVLSISAANVGVIYGHAPPPLTAYKLAGFVNGDTASVVSGAPILTTTVTAKTPVGVYPIGVQVGSLTATNYSFSTLSNGMGGVQVYKTHLSIEALSVSTTYGQTPPPLTGYRLLGFVAGDTASVVTGAPILSTAVTVTTRPGTYPITVSTGSLAAANYVISPAPTQGSVLVNKAVLHVQAKNVATVYGQTPPGLTAYNLLGFVNGDTTSVVTGAPTLSTTVTAATPVGVYQIGVQVGTLKAANYAFSTFSSGMGSVQVYKATLQLIANNLTMTQGSAVPPLTYTLSGFVNSDTAGTSVTGAPLLTTSVTSATKPGRYYIIPSNGTLTAQNYTFHPVYGILTVLP